MIKAVIKKNSVETNSAVFSDLALAQSWVDAESEKGSFGKPDRWVLESDALVSEDTGQAIGEKTEGGFKFYHFAAEFSVEFVDVTMATAIQKKMDDRKKKRMFGEYMVDKIATVNDAKHLTIDQVDAFMSHPVVANLREHLWSGNIDTFVDKLSSVDVSAFFSDAEKTGVIAECQAFLDNL